MYVSTWVDTMNTTILAMRGNANPSGRVITMDEPMLGVIGRMLKYVSRFVDENTFRFEIYDLHAGDDYKVLERLLYGKREYTGRAATFIGVFYVLGGLLFIFVCLAMVILGRTLLPE